MNNVEWSGEFQELSWPGAAMTSVAIGLIVLAIVAMLWFVNRRR